MFRANSGSQQYAMKVCLCEPDQPWRKLMYKTEADILKSLDHPNVVKYIDDLQFGDMTILVMEQCQGGVRRLKQCSVTRLNLTLKTNC